MYDLHGRWENVIVTTKLYECSSNDSHKEQEFNKNSKILRRFCASPEDQQRCLFLPRTILSRLYGSVEIKKVLDVTLHVTLYPFQMKCICFGLLLSIRIQIFLFFQITELWNLSWLYNSFIQRGFRVTIWISRYCKVQGIFTVQCNLHVVLPSQDSGAGM